MQKLDICKMKYSLLIIPILLLGFSEGDYVPAFELQDYYTPEKVASFDIFKSDLSIVIFWSTYCDECIEAFESTWLKEDDFANLGIEVFTVNMNLQSEKSDADDIAESCPFNVLYDRNQIVATQYGANVYSYIAYVFGKNGRILQIFDESNPQAGDDLLLSVTNFSNALDAIKKDRAGSEEYEAFDPINNNTVKVDAESFTEPRAEMPAPVQNNVDIVQAISSRFSITGNGKVLYQFVPDEANEIHGAYGEPMTVGSSFLFKFEPDLKYRITDDLYVGSVIRMTNISNYLLLGAPDYFTSNVFSPYFIYFPNDELTIRAGFFRTSFTPLTLMRWDENDNPPGAGGTEGGCRVCDGLPGGISSENLEELGPDLGFEGINVKGSIIKPLSFEGFYARAQQASNRCDLYLRNMAGLRLKFAKNSNRYIAMNLIATDEEIGICSDPNLAYMKQDYRQQENVSFNGNYRFFNHLDIFGEFAYSHSLDQYPDSTMEYEKTYEDIAYMAGFAFDYETKWDMDFDIDFAYTSLGENYLSTYKALSYLNNNHGYRIRSSIETKYGSLSIFMKKLENDEIDSLDVYKGNTQLGFGIHPHISIKKTPVYLDFTYIIDEYMDNYSSRIVAGNQTEDIRKITSIALNFVLSKHLNFQIQAQNIDQDLMTGYGVEEGEFTSFSSNMALRF